METWSDALSGLTVLCFLLMIPDAMTTQCYSCMAKTLGSLWKDAGLDEIFVEPEAFTDLCKRPEKNRQTIFIRPCATTCITMLIELSFGMGAKTHIRGCYDTIFLYGFNDRGALGRLKTREVCQRYNLSQVVNRRIGMYDSILEVCSCHGRLCNGGSIAFSGTRLISPNWTLLLHCALIVLIVRKVGASSSCCAIAVLSILSFGCLIGDFDAER